MGDSYETYRERCNIKEKRELYPVLVIQEGVQLPLLFDVTPFTVSFIAVIELIVLVLAVSEILQRLEDHFRSDELFLLCSFVYLFPLQQDRHHASFGGKPRHLLH